MPDTIGGLGIQECALCRKKFTQTLGVVLRGQPDLRNHSAHIERQVQQLHDHLADEHPKHYEAIAAYTAQYRGWLALSNFRSTDEKIRTARDQMRWYIHSQTRNATIPDRNLLPKARELAEEIAVKVYNGTNEQSSVADIATIIFESIAPILQGFRDELQEPGKYPPLIGEKRDLSVLLEPDETSNTPN